MITEDEVRAAKGMDYWAKRYERWKEKTPGTSNAKMEVQDREYEAKKAFLRNFIPLNLKTLEIGCGIGRMSDLFDDYYGYDPIKEAVDLAKKRNSTKKFTISEQLVRNYKPEMVFFSTVLQHIEKPEEVIKDYLKANVIVLFENVTNAPNKNYLFFRPKDYYIGLLNKTHKCESYIFNHVYYNRMGKKQLEPHVLVIGRKK